MIRRKDGRYQQALSVKNHGETKLKYFYGKTKSEVYKKIAAYEEQQENGRTLKEVAEEWWDSHTDVLAHNTVKGYTAAYNRLIDHFGDLFIKDITAKQITLWLNTLADMKYSQKTILTHKLVANLIFKHAYLNEEVFANPCEYIVLPKGRPKQKRQIASDEDIQKIKANVDKPYGLLHFFVLYTGCRRGEAMAIKFKDIDRDNNLIHITKSVYYESATPKIKTPKTEAGNRDIVLLDVLKKHLPKGKPDDFLFFPNGLPAKPTFDRHLKKYREETGITCTLHQLRHAYATILYEAGIDEKAAQHLLGHSSILMTKDIYTHIRESKDSLTASILNAYVKKV